NRRLGRRKAPRRTIPAHRQFKRPRPLGTACLDSTSQRPRHGSDRTPPPPALRLHSGGNGKTRLNVVDFPRSVDAVRHSNGKRAANRPHGPGALPMERKENSSPRSRTKQAASLHTLLPVEGGY